MRENTKFLCHSASECSITWLGFHQAFTHLLEGSLSQQMSFDSRQSFVRIIISLLNQAQLLSL